MDLYDVWPFNMSSGPAFLLLMLLVAAGSMTIASVVSRVSGWLLETGEAPGIVVPHADYRQPGLPAPRRRLARGAAPMPEDAWAIAFARGGENGLSEALFAAAVALGWITMRPTSMTVRASAVPSDPLLASLHRQLGVGTITYRDLRRATLAVAKEARPELEALLAKAGLLRTAGVRAVVMGLVLLGGVTTEAIGLVRLVRGLELARPIAFLVVELLLLSYLSYRLVRRAAERRSARADRYVKWLDDVTTSLRRGVCDGHRTSADEIAMVAAISGLTAIGPAPMLLGFQPNLFAASTVASIPTSTGCSSSSCSSSSCSSGSSCGGGGGCGG